MINLTRMYAVLLRQFYLMRSSPSRLLPLFAWIAIDMILWGFITLYFSEISTFGTLLIPILLGAVLLWEFFTRVMHSITISFMEDVWSRNFLNIFASPITIPEYIGGFILTSVFTGLIGLLALLFISSVFFGFSIFIYGLSFIPFFFILYLFAISLGILGCAMVLRLGPSAEWFIWPIPALLSPFACVFYPLSNLPLWMQKISLLLPPTYVFEGMRALINGGGLIGGDLLIGTLLAFGYLLVSGAVFVFTFNRAKKSGLLARYSAESVN